MVLAMVQLVYLRCCELMTLAAIAASGFKFQKAVTFDFKIAVAALRHR